MFHATRRGFRGAAVGLLLLPAFAHVPATALAQKSPAAADSAGAGEQLLEQARIALDRKDYQTAQSLALKAKASGIRNSFWEKSADDILSEVAERTGQKPADAPVSDDPRVLLKQGRLAMKAGELDKALTLARQAESLRDRTSWGLFEDTPSSLLRDVQKAKQSQDREVADGLLKQARAMYAQSQQMRDPRQRLETITKAEQIAYRAARLHGPYSIWDLGDRPATLIGEIEADRARLRRVAMPPIHQPTEVVKAPEPEAPQPEPVPVRTVSHQQEPGEPRHPSLPSLPETELPAPTPPETAPAGEDTERAIALVGEARALIVAGQPAGLILAREKLLEAQKMKVAFGPAEDGPEQLLHQVTVTGKQMIQAIVREADDQAARGESGHKKATAALKAARDMAAGLGLDTQPIDQRMTVLAPRPEMSLPDVTLPEPTLPDGAGVAVVGAPDVSPSLPTPPGMPEVPVPGVEVPVPGFAANHGHQLLENARMELRSGNTEMARRMVEEAFAGPYGVQDQAQVLLREVMAEDAIQKGNASMRSLENGLTAYRNKDYRQALAIFEQIDASALPPTKQSHLRDLASAARREVEAAQPESVALRPNPDLAEVQPVAHSQEASGPDSLTSQMQAMQEVQFQKLRREGLEAQAGATKMFGRGETDAAIKLLEDYVAKVQSSELEPSRLALLQRPIEYRMQNFKLLKRQKDFYTDEERGLRAARDEIASKATARQRKEEQVSKLMQDYNNLLDNGKYEDAKMLAMKAHELDPDNPVTKAAMQIATIRSNEKMWNDIQERNAEHRIHDINDAFDMGPVVTDRDPVHFDAELMNRNRGRLAGRDGVRSMKAKSDAEKVIEMKLTKPVTVDFHSVPLGQALDDLRVMTGVNLIADLRSMSEAGVQMNHPVTLRVEAIPLQSALNLLLQQVKLTHIIEDNVLKVTSERHARGRLARHVYSVADLVVPIDNYAVPHQQNLINVMERLGQQAQNPISGGIQNSQLANNPLGLQNGMPVGEASLNTPGVTQAGGQLQNNPVGPMGSSAFVTSAQNTMEQALIKLITNTIEPDTWDSLGGPGTINYYPIGMALVVNQTADVIEQVSDLLQALRELQDLEVAVEVRLISLSESFFERIGMDFAVNIETKNTTLEPQLTTGLFAPAPYINNLNHINGATLGLTPAGTFTSDLNVPIRASSFEYAIPPFGNFPNNPGFNGGLSLGLAFLNDIQVFMFMEAAQGDTRVNVMQAPKITLFNGQTSTLIVNTNQFFVTSVSVLGSAGQIVFVPSNTPIPAAPPGQPGIVLSLQAVVSADRRFVRLNLNPQLVSLASASVPLFPITTFVTPVFEGGSQGQPIPFTQFIQQPAFDVVNVQTTVQVPDGGTVLLGGLKTLSEGRNEFGPPILSKIPYVNRLVRNTGYGRDAQSLMIMVTPRIIINSEEERRQTGLDTTVQVP